MFDSSLVSGSFKPETLPEALTYRYWTVELLVLVWDVGLLLATFLADRAGTIGAQTCLMCSIDPFLGRHTL